MINRNSCDKCFVIEKVSLFILFVWQRKVSVNAAFFSSSVSQTTEIQFRGNWFEGNTQIQTLGIKNDIYLFRRTTHRKSCVALVKFSVGENSLHLVKSVSFSNDSN